MIIVQGPPPRFSPVLPLHLVKYRQEHIEGRPLVFKAPIFEKALILLPNGSIGTSNACLQPHHLAYHLPRQRFILSSIGNNISKDGRLPGSSCMQMRISLAMCGDTPGPMDIRRPSSATFMPHSIGDRSANGTCE